MEEGSWFTPTRLMTSVASGDQRLFRGLLLRVLFPEGNAARPESVPSYLAHNRQVRRLAVVAGFGLRRWKGSHSRPDPASVFLQRAAKGSPSGNALKGQGFDGEGLLIEPDRGQKLFERFFFKVC